MGQGRIGQGNANCGRGRRKARLGGRGGAGRGGGAWGGLPGGSRPVRRDRARVWPPRA